MTTSDLVRAALAWLATYGLHSTLFLGGTWAVCALRPPRVNRNRERLWKLALLGGFVSATLQIASGARPFLGRIDWRAAPAAREETVAAKPRRALDESLFHRASRPAGESMPAEESALSPSPDPSAPSSASSASAELRSESRAPVSRLEAELASSAAPEETREHSAGLAPGVRARLGASLSALPGSKHWTGLLLGLWSACGLAGVAGLAFSWSSLRRRMLGRRRLVDGPLVELLERVRARAGVRQRVRLSVSSRISAPFSTGLLRPEVCVPTAVLTTLTRAQQEALLAHELAHLVRRDPAWFGLGYVIEKLFFFQPLNRLARRHLSELAEVACDDWAVRWTGARVALASCLAEVAGWVVGERPRLVMPPGLAGHRSRLGQRVERLLDDRRSPACDPPARWWPPLAAGALAVATLAVPGVSADAARPRASTPRFVRAPANAALEPVLPEAPPLEPPTEPERSIRIDLAAAREMLEMDLARLESEIAALRAELVARALDERLGGALQRIEARMDELRAQEQRARELFARLSTPHTPASTPAPLADALPPTANPGDFR